MDIPFLSHLPSPTLMNQAYNFVVDAIFGFSFKGEPRPPFKDVIPALKELSCPVISIDVPSGKSRSIVFSFDERYLMQEEVFLFIFMTKNLHISIIFKEIYYIP